MVPRIQVGTRADPPGGGLSSCARGLWAVWWGRESSKLMPSQGAGPCRSSRTTTRNPSEDAGRPPALNGKWKATRNCRLRGSAERRPLRARPRNPCAGTGNGSELKDFPRLHFRSMKQQRIHVIWRIQGVGQGCGPPRTPKTPKRRPGNPGPDFTHG